VIILFVAVVHTHAHTHTYTYTYTNINTPIHKHARTELNQVLFEVRFAARFFGVWMRAEDEAAMRDVLQRVLADYTTAYASRRENSIVEVGVWEKRVGACRV